MLATRIADRFARAVLAAAIPRRSSSGVRSSARWRPSARRARATATTPAACSSRSRTAASSTCAAIPDHHVARGKLCRKCSIGYNGAFLDPELRLTTPLRRIGPKGEGRFEPVDWAEAIAAIAARLQRDRRRARRGERPQRALHGHLRADRHGLPAALLQPPRRDRGGARHRLQQRRPRRARLRLRLERGGLRSRGRGRGRLHRRVGREPLGERAARSTTTGCARRRGQVDRDRPDPHADRRGGRHLPPAAPGQRRGARLRARARDPPRRPRRRGVRRARTCSATTSSSRCSTPARPPGARQQTGVPARADRARRARRTARGPSLLWMGQGLQRQPRGGNVMRAIAMLPALTGNIRRPGSGFLVPQRRRVARDRLRLAHRRGARRRRMRRRAISQMDLADVLADPARSRALVCWNINPVASSPRAGGAARGARARRPAHGRVRPLPHRHRGLRRLRAAGGELPRVRRHPRLVLPPHALGPGQGRRAARATRCATPRSSAASRPPWASTSRSCRRATRALIERLLARSGVDLGRARARRHGAPLRRAARAVRRRLPDARAAGSRSPRRSAEADGHPRLPEPSVDAAAPPGHLRLLSPASPWLMNSTFGNDRKLRQRIGPATRRAAPARGRRPRPARGRRGRRCATRPARSASTVDITDAVPPGVAYAPKGRWPSHESAGANVNALNPGAKTDMGESSAVHGVLVELVPG